MNNSLKLLASLLLLLCGANAWSQTKVTGKCVDKKGNALFGVIVTAEGNTSEIPAASTDENGEFLLLLRPGLYQFKFAIFGEMDSVLVRTISVPVKETFHIGTVKFNFSVNQLEGGVVKASKDPSGMLNFPVPDLQKLPIGSVEKFLTFSTMANSTNELSNNYNVRGGNYDENLVYVNGFLINRPFLTRSGQQEGMSFINTALVDRVYFSGGGFQAVYGDKLSSVLDVRYKQPDSLKVSVMASLLGVEASVQQGIGSRFRYLFGARYRSNGYLLNSLPTKGSYNPVYMDAQFLTEYDITEKWKLSVLGHFSSNKYRFTPQSQQTDFGTANEAYAFNIYFDGQENTSFLTGTAGTSLTYAGKKFSSTTYLTYFHTDENERFDIEGQYYINELENDPGKENYGDSINVLGVGTYLDHARNRLQAQIFAAYQDNVWNWSKNAALKFGIGAQYEDFHDVLSEWHYIDSAGYSMSPTNTPGVDLYETIKGRLSLQNVKSWGYVQQHFQWKQKENTLYLSHEEVRTVGKKKVREIIRDTIATHSRLELELGTRVINTTFNNDFMVTPRASITYYPAKYVYHNGRFLRRSMSYSLSAGTYYQPPFYREYRTFDGTLNPGVVSQKSAHFVLNANYNFYMWGRDRPFKFVTEAYYKYLWDVNSYEVDNVRTRYFANNQSKAYATGIDFMLNGEFVEGIPSFFRVSLLSTKENVLNDYYYNYLNAEGQKITPEVTDQKVSDSAIVYPGYIRRPTDQHLTVSTLFQDKMPSFEQLTAQITLMYGSRLPTGPPSHTRYADTLTLKSYFRVDLGISYDFMHNRAKVKNKWYGKLQDAILSFEVFNLLGINNVLSKQWVQDTQGNYYSIPNYLTQRRFNLKLIVRI